MDEFPYSEPFKMEDSSGTTKWYVTDNATRELVEVDPDQRWFWTHEWQKGEMEADADIAAGRYTTYANADEFLKSFDK